jgi:hypothetical protein
MYSSWEYWINEPVFLDKGISNILKRKQAVSIFVKEGLLPLLESNGYKLILNEARLTKTLLQMLFALYKGEKIKPHLLDGNLPEEHLHYFEYRLDSSVWDSFWTQWGSFQDFEEGRCGESLRWTLPSFVWSWIDFESSTAIYQIQKEIEEEIYQEEGSKGKEDPYLQETSKRDYQDRHW